MKKFMDLGDSSIHPENRAKFMQIFINGTEKYLLSKNMGCSDLSDTEREILWSLSKTRLELELIKGTQKMLNRVLGI